MRAHRVSWMIVMSLGVAACAPWARPAAPAPAAVRPGLEVLLSDSLHIVQGRRVGLLTNHSGVDRQGRRGVDLLRAAGVRVTALLSPEHGFLGAEDRPGLPDGVDSSTGLPIYSLYSGSRPPNLAGLDSVDVVLADLQDVGARYYTYVWYAAFLARELAARGKPLVVLDRPNPVGGTLVQGNTRDTGLTLAEQVGFLPVAMRHGLTLGELTLLANDALALGADITVVPAAGWRRAMYYDETGIPWVRPSPNLPSLESAIHYAGLCLVEGTNLSVGRGTAIAFQVVGAPWLDPAAVLRRLDRHPGVAITPFDFTPRSPTDAKYDGVPLRGLRFQVTDRSRYDPTSTAVAVLAAIRAVHPDALRFRSSRFDLLAAGPALREGLLAGRSPAELAAAWDAGLRRFAERRSKYLLY